MSQAMNGFLSGLGQGIAEVGKTAFNAQIEQAREARLRKYQMADRAQARADQKEDYKQQRTDKLADTESDRTYQKEVIADDRKYRAGETKADRDFQIQQQQAGFAHADSQYDRRREDQLEDQKTLRDQSLEDAKTAAAVEAQKWDNLKPVTAVNEDMQEVVVGFIGSQGGKMMYLDSKTGNISPFGQTDINNAIGQEYGAPTPAKPAASAPPGASGAGLLTWKPPT